MPTSAEQSVNNSTKSQRAIFVDLDGTLTACDLLADAVARAFKTNPLNAFCLLLWSTRGRAHLKRKMAQCVTPDVAKLPYRQEVIDFLTTQKASLRCPIILATASDELWARRVAQHFDLFDDVLASNGDINLKGRTKLEAIQAYCRQHNYSSFDYIGDSPADIPIWRAAATALAVVPGRPGILSLNGDGRGEFTRRRLPKLSLVLSAMRPQQWIKNLLLLTPLMLAHQVTNLPKLFACLAAIFAFCMCASSIYIVNDLLDTEADRNHPKKKHRPFASGKLPMAVGPPLAAGLAGIGMFVAFVWLSTGFQLLLVGYLFLTTIYSLWLKTKVMIDVVLLAVLYTLRVVAGGLAAEVEVSEWMMSFSMFIFTSLAFAKRYSELVRLNATAGSDGNSGRGYQPQDMQMLGTMGPASGCLSVLVLALYLNSDQVRELYTSPLGLWPLCPMLLYWVGRLWIIAGRGELPDDPVAYAATDWLSWLIALGAALILMVAT